MNLEIWDSGYHVQLAVGIQPPAQSLCSSKGTKIIPGSCPGGQPPRAIELLVLLGLQVLFGRPEQFAYFQQSIFRAKQELSPVSTLEASLSDTQALGSRIGRQPSCLLRTGMKWLCFLDAPWNAPVAVQFARKRSSLLQLCFFQLTTYMLECLHMLLLIAWTISLPSH